MTDRKQLPAYDFNEYMILWLELGSYPAILPQRTDEQNLLYYVLSVNVIVNTRPMLRSR